MLYIKEMDEFLYGICHAVLKEDNIKAWIADMLNNCVLQFNTQEICCCDILMELHHNWLSYEQETLVANSELLLVI